MHLSLSRQKANRYALDWTQDEAEVPGNTTHLWEESWDDDDTSEDFSAQLKYAYTITPNNRRQCQQLLINLKVLHRKNAEWLLW